VTPDKKEKPEFRADAWERFERAIDVVAKSPPQHRVKAKRKSNTNPTKAKSTALGRRASRASE